MAVLLLAMLDSNSVERAKQSTQLFQIFLRVLLKLAQAGLAAEFDFLTLIDDALLVTHRSKIVVGDDACLQRVWLGASK